MNFMALKSRENIPFLWLISLYRTLKGMQSSKQGVRNGYHLSIEGVRKGSPPCKHLLITPPPLPEGCVSLVDPVLVKTLRRSSPFITNNSTTSRLKSLKYQVTQSTSWIRRNVVRIRFAPSFCQEQSVHAHLEAYRSYCRWLVTMGINSNYL